MNVDIKEYTMNLLNEAIAKGLKTPKEQLHYIMQTSHGHLNPKSVEEIIEKENEHSNSKSL